MSILKCYCRESVGQSTKHEKKNWGQPRRWGWEKERAYSKQGSRTHHFGERICTDESRQVTRDREAASETWFSIPSRRQGCVLGVLGSWRFREYRSDQVCPLTSGRWRFVVSGPWQVEWRPHEGILRDSLPGEAAFPTLPSATLEEADN